MQTGWRYSPIEQVPTAALAGTREEVKKDESIASKMRVVCIAGNQCGIRWMFQEEALCYFDRCVFLLLYSRQYSMLLSIKK